VSGFWDAVKFGFRFSPIGIPYVLIFGDAYAREREIAKNAVELALQVVDQADRLKLKAQKEIAEVLQAILDGDKEKLQQKLDGLSEEARKAVEIATDVMTELAISAIDLDPRTKGRIYGWLLYQVAETLATVGVAKAIEAGALTRLAAKLPEALQDARIVAALRKVAAAFEKGEEAEEVAAKGRQAASKLKDADALKPAKAAELPKESIPSVEPQHPPTKPKWEKPKGWRLPNNGTWEGTPGDSNFIPRNPAELGLKPGETVPFHEGKPDFSKWSKGNFTSREPLTGNHPDDMPKMIRTIAEKKGWTQQRVKEWLKKERLSPHHAGGNEIQLIPWDLHGNPSAKPPIQGIRHMGPAYDLRNPQ